jgi:hypothetical protein
MVMLQPRARMQGMRSTITGLLLVEPVASSNHAAASGCFLWLHAAGEDCCWWFWLLLTRRM